MEWLLEVGFFCAMLILRRRNLCQEIADVEDIVGWRDMGMFLEMYLK